MSDLMNCKLGKMGDPMQDKLDVTKARRMYQVVEGKLVNKRLAQAMMDSKGKAIPYPTDFSSSGVRIKGSKK